MRLLCHWILIVLVYISLYHAQFLPLDQIHYTFQCLYFPSVGKLPIHLQPSQTACYNFTLNFIPAALSCDKHEELFTEIELFCRQHLQYPIPTQCAHYLIQQFRIAVAAESSTDHTKNNNSVKVIVLAISVDSHFHIYLNPYVPHLGSDLLTRDHSEPHLGSDLLTRDHSSVDTGNGQCKNNDDNCDNSHSVSSSKEGTNDLPRRTATNGLCDNNDSNSSSSSSSSEQQSTLTTPQSTPLTHLTRFTIITYHHEDSVIAFSSTPTESLNEINEEFPALTEEMLAWNAPSVGVGSNGHIGMTVISPHLTPLCIISPSVAFHPCIISPLHHFTLYIILFVCRLTSISFFLYIISTLFSLIGQLDSGDPGNEDDGRDSSGSDTGGGTSGSDSSNSSNEREKGADGGNSQVDPGEDVVSKRLIEKLPKIADESTEHGFIHPGLALYTSADKGLGVFAKIPFRWGQLVEVAPALVVPDVAARVVRSGRSAL